MRAAQTAFERFEFKYVVSEQRAKELLQRTASYLRSDDWAPGGQRITSLYLDSPGRDFMQLHREGAPDRSKLRVRAYGDPLADQAFFEIKRKIKRVTFKHRAIVPQSAVPMLLRGELGPTRLVKSEEEQRTLEHFLYLMLTYRAEPTVLTTCCREAFTAIEPADEVRLTLDRDISYQPARGSTLKGDPQAWVRLCGYGNYLPTAPVLIELKFRGIAPLWVQDLVQELKLTVSSYSKYVTAMTVDELDPESRLGWDLASPLSALSARVP